MALCNPLLWSYSSLALVFNGIYTMWQVAIPLDLHAHGFNETYYGAFSAANAIQVVCMSLLLTGLVARLSRTTTLALASLLLGAGLGLYAWTHSVADYLIGVFIWTCGEIIYYPLSTALIAAISPVHLRGVYQGFLGLPECNTLFVLKTHLIRSADYWVLGMARGKPQARNRQAEFEASGTRAEILADYQRWLAEMHSTLSILPAERLSEIAPGEAPLTIRDVFLHSLQHCSAHLDHIQLTRLLLGYAPPKKMLPQVPNGILEPAR